MCDLSRANECLQERVYDLILLDVMLPDGNGLHWLRDQAAIERQQVPVIVLSANTETESVLDSMQIGTAQFLSKSLANFVSLPDLIDDCIDARYVMRDRARTIDRVRVA